VHITKTQGIKCKLCAFIEAINKLGAIFGAIIELTAYYFVKPVVHQVQMFVPIPLRD